MQPEKPIQIDSMDSETRSSRPKQSEPPRRPILWIVLALGFGLTLWEYGLTAFLNPEVNWNLLGLSAHALLDIAVISALLGLAFFGVSRIARLIHLDLRSDVAGAVGLGLLVTVLVVLPWTSSRDLAHEALGQRWNISLAEVQTTVVGSDLTVEETSELCSFGSVRNPSSVRQDSEILALAGRVQAGFRDVLLQMVFLFPVFLLLAFSAKPGRWSEILRLGSLWRPRLVRLALLGGGVFILYCVVPISSESPNTAEATGQLPYDACRDGGPVRQYSVSAIDVTITLNRWGDYVPGTHMYALDANIPAIREFESNLARDRAAEETLDATRVSYGLRKDPIQPLVLRANLGECLRVNFTNDLSDGDPASLHILGLPHTANNAGSAVGENPNTLAGPGETITYEIPLPYDPGAERAYYFHDHGAGRKRQNMGLFGAIVAEPAGSVYLDVETGAVLDTETGSNWEAIILDPNQNDAPDGKSFREFVIFYHEIGDEAFTDLRDKDDKKLPLIDDIAGVYRPAARALNYRSEPFRRRLEVESTGKSLGYSSYPFGDPATPIPRSYVGEGVKTRLLHGGSEIFHVHHLHGGGDRWRRNPNADANNDFWKGLTKVPDPNLTSIHLDSQSIGPGTSYNLEHECGAGGCQQGVGDFLFHCHIGHHYISGMWSFWRVFGTMQDGDTNVHGNSLAVIPDLFQNPDNPIMPPTPPEEGVSAGDLIGLRVDGGKVLVADQNLTDPAHEIGVLDWVEAQLPPPGERLDKHDATVWNWTYEGSGSDLIILGEPESTESFPGWISTQPGVRPEVLFNPKNGRYTWPLFRTQKGQRPPFTARHSGAPWLGERMKDGRLDGLCAANGVDPDVDVGDAVKRFYPVSAITLPIQVTQDRNDPNGMLYVLNEEEDSVLNGERATEPLAIRSNVGDCVEITLTNKIPDAPINKDFSKVNIHSHFVQFDTQASDGVITGYSYEQSVRPFANEERELTVGAQAGDTVIQVNHTNRLRSGIWIGVGLGEGTCGESDEGQPLPCTEVRKIADLTTNTITLENPLRTGHAAGEAVGVEFVRYLWMSDVDFGTVFFHSHVEFKDWDHGLFGAHIVEPKGSTYHDPFTGEEVRSGSLVDIRVDPEAGGNPVASDVSGSFREFMLFLQNNNPVEGQFQLGGGTINLRAEPWRLREGESAYRFSSVRHGDPTTPIVRTYVGDPVIVRGLGLVERVGGIRFTGHRFHQERTSSLSDTRDTTFIGISERFDLSLEGGAGGPGGFPGDYLYYSTLGRDFESGAWGILRVHDSIQSDLQALPDREQPWEGEGFPSLSFTGENPPQSYNPIPVCPEDAPIREYPIVVDDAAIAFHDESIPEAAGVVYRLQGQGSNEARTPLVIRANAGDCLRLKVRNNREVRSSISLGEVAFEPQRNYGSAIGYNYDSTIEPGKGRVYEYYADRELGLVLALNLGDVDSISHGAFAGVVVEKEGATYTRPGRNEALPAGGVGIQADIWHDGDVTREFVALFSDQDRRIGQNRMPYPVAVENFSGISYSANPLSLRGLSQDPSSVFKSELWGDSRHVVTLPSGVPLTYRVAQPWGDQIHVPTLEGHRWYQEPGMEGSEQVYADVLAPGMSLNLNMVGGAGGGINAPGDFLFLDRRQPFMEGGLWHLLRVTDDGTSGGTDSMKVFFAEGSASGLTVQGQNTIRPAGDFASQVMVYSEGSSGDGCGGDLLGHANVDPGSGAWSFHQELASLPTEVCIISNGGAISTAPVQ